MYLGPEVSISTKSSETFIGNARQVESTANKHIKSSIFNRSKLFFNANDLEQKLNVKYPEFESIEVVTYPLRKNPVLLINFSQPAFKVSSNDKIYIVSKSGKAIADYSTIDNQAKINELNLPLLIDLTEIDIRLGSQALTSKQADYIREIEFQTKQNDIKTSKIELAPGGGELRVYYGGADYYVKYNFFEDPRESSGAYLAINEELNKKGQTPKEYIDLRVAERAYIK